LVNAETVLAPEDPSGETEEGALYQIVIRVKGKFDAHHVKAVIDLVELGAGLNDSGPWDKMTGYWSIQDVVAESDVWQNVVPLVNNGPSEEWRLRVTAVKLKGTPVVVAVGVILALLIILVGVVGWNAYKIKPLVKPIADTIVVVVVAAVIIAALVFKGRMT
jgi:hypothetical protein